MSAAFFNQMADPKKAKAISAGTQPGERVHPEVVEVMKEVGADLSSETPKYLSRNLLRPRACWSQWVVGTLVPLFLGWKRMIGHSKTPKESRFNESGKYGMRSDQECPASFATGSGPVDPNWRASSQLSSAEDSGLQ